MFDDVYGALYAFLKNASGVAVAAGVCCVSKGETARAAFNITALGGADEGALFAGSRLVGSNSLAANEFGWFGVKGRIYVTDSGAGVTADTLVIMAASGEVKDVTNDAAGYKGNFAMSATVIAADALGYVYAFRNCWGL